MIFWKGSKRQLTPSPPFLRIHWLSTPTLGKGLAPKSDEFQTAPAPHFRTIILQFFYDRHGCIYARRCEGQIVWNACTWFPEIGTILIFLYTIVHTLNPEITLLYQFCPQKAPFRVSKICNINVWIEHNPSPPRFENFLKIHPIW